MLHQEITLLFDRVQSGRDEAAVAELWEAYCACVVTVAQRYLRDRPKRVADEDDVANSAMQFFFRTAEAGRFHSVKNRDDLWKKLLTFTVRKVNRHQERAMAQKRGGGLVDGESGFANGTVDDPHGLNEIPDEGFVAELMVECHDRINALPNPMLQQIAMQRLEGFSVKEIAALQGVANRQQRIEQPSIPRKRLPTPSSRLLQ